MVFTTALTEIRGFSYSDVQQAKSPLTHTHTFNGPLSETTRVSRYQKGKTNLDFTEARDSEWMPFLSPNQQHQSTEGTESPLNTTQLTNQVTGDNILRTDKKVNQHGHKTVIQLSYNCDFNNTKHNVI